MIIIDIRIVLTSGVREEGTLGLWSLGGLLENSHVVEWSSCYNYILIRLHHCFLLFFPSLHPILQYNRFTNAIRVMETKSREEAVRNILRYSG